MGDPGDRIPGPDADVLDLFLSFSDSALLGDGLDQQNLKAWGGAISRDGDFGSPRPDGCRREDDWNEARGSSNHRRASMGQTDMVPRSRGTTTTACGQLSLGAQAAEVQLDSVQPLTPSAAGIRSGRVRRWCDVVTDMAQISLDRGFPDGKFTACGIDRAKQRRAYRSDNDRQSHVCSCRGAVRLAAPIQEAPAWVDRTQWA